MIRALLIGLIAVFSTAAKAQEITVRSGEHGSFTRLVFDIPAGLAWSSKTAPDQNRITVEFERSGLSFDVSKVFQRIARTRVADIKPIAAESSVLIDLGCACEAELFLASAVMLVADIKPARIKEPVATGDPELTDLAKSLSAVNLGDGPGIGPAAQAAPFSTEFLLDESVLGLPDEEKPAERAEHLTSDILRDVAQAANSGLLNATVQQIAPAQDAAVDEGAVLKPSETLDPPEPQPQVSLQDIQKQMDTDGRVSIGGLACVADQELNIGGWSEEEDVALALANGRADLFQEFDRVSPKAITGLARTMLHFGMGAETRAILAISPDEPPALLVALSHIVDGEPDPEKFFGRQIECAGRAGLWAILATRERFDPTKVDQNAVARSFEELPLHLRETLGPQLAKRYSDIGETSAAQDILRRLERSLGGPNDKTVFAQAEIALAEGDHEKAHKEFVNLADSTSRQAPDALIAALEITQEQHAEVTDDLVDLSAAFASELENAQQGPKLWQAHIRALLASGQTNQAIEVFLDPPENAEREKRVSADEVARAAISDTSDAVFLELALGRLIPTSETDQVRIVHDTAERLLSLGIADQALSELRRLTNAQATPDTILLKARAMLDLGQPTEAEILLIGRQDHDAKRLRAKARAAMGDYTHASALFAEIGETAMQEKIARMAGAWSDLSASHTELSQAAALISKPPVSVDESAITLAQAQNLSRESASAREILRDLLASTEID
ncbi:hypothetical protein [Thalassococcus lentus]|uniref:Uncharacterized protein n=1 Tax=Thalassococcus lentus TaxID=1210524 RepID=A0ABT4XN18_9RHOB|nr:hypothetical protein [Thalassococcus lentus]MDA7423336.1 hypothetical protein [Thalassococcus lentus]